MPQLKAIWNDSMTKDGRTSLLNDIRYFFGTDRRSNVYLENHEDAVAYGRRIALLLNSKGVSFGSYSALYIQFNPTLEPEVVEVQSTADDKWNSENWWFKYVNVGVPADFLARSDVSIRCMDSTVQVLRTIRPDLSQTIDDFDKTRRIKGDAIRFLLKKHRTKNYLMEVSFNLPVWKQPALLYLSLLSHTNGEYLEAPPFILKSYEDAFALSGSIALKNDTFQLLPRNSFKAQLTVDDYDFSPSKHISEFTSKSERPMFSELLKRYGESA